MPIRRLLSAVAGIAALGLSSAFAGQTIYIYGTKPSSTASLAGWNGCSLYNDHQPVVYSNLKDDTDNQTGVSLFVLTPAVCWYDTATLAFTGEAAEFEAARQAFGNVVSCSTDPTLDDSKLGSSFRGYREDAIRGRFEGLDPAKFYVFTFVGQRGNGSDNASTRYAVFGANEDSAVVDAAQNTTKVAVLSGIAPRSDGSVEFTVAAAEGNATWMRFGYLNAIKIEEMETIDAEDIYISLCGIDTSKATAKYVWNSLDCTTVGNRTAGLKNSAGETTDVAIEHTGGNATLSSKPVSTPFTGDAAEFEELRNGSETAYFAYVGNRNALNLLVSGLDVNATYDFTLLPSRPVNSTDRYDVKFYVEGASSKADYVDAGWNFTRVAFVSGIRPKTADATGTIRVILKGHDLAKDGDYFNKGNTPYVFAMKIHRHEKLGSNVRRVAVTATAGGTVTATVGGADSENVRFLTAEETLVATATPQSNYRFVGWTSSNGDALVTENPLSVSGANSVTWTAVFKKYSTSESDDTRTVYVATASTPPADEKTWNALSDASYGRGGVQRAFYAADGRGTSLGLETVRPWGVGSNGSKPNTGGNPSAAFTGDLSDFEAARSLNRSLWMRIAGTETIASNCAYVVYDVCGLKAGMAYTFRFASANGTTTDARKTQFRCVGANTVFSTVNASGNVSTAAVCAGVIADANGKVRLEILPGVGNTNANRFSYLTAFAIEGALSERPGKRILWWGNSFSQMYDVSTRVYHLALLCGFDAPVIVKGFKSGKGTAYHLEQVLANPVETIDNPSLRYGCAPLDTVIVQGRNREMTDLCLGGDLLPEVGYVSNAVALVDLAMGTAAASSATKVVVYEPWAFGREFTDEHFAGYGQPDCFASPSVMQSQIRASARLAQSVLGEKYDASNVSVARVGTAFQLEKFATDLYDVDHFHQSEKLGAELAALVIFQQVYGVRVADHVTLAAANEKAAKWQYNEFKDLTDEDWTRLLRAADRRMGLILSFEGRW